MPFNEQLPEWLAPGIEPPASKKASGWSPSDKPPADYFNWLFHRAFMALQELQQNAADKNNLTPEQLGAQILGTNNQDLNLVKAAELEIDTRTPVLTYTNGDLTKVEEKDGTVVVKSTELTYSNGRLTTVKETAGGKIVTQTLNYDGNGVLTSVTKVVV